jgi:hypothetical protein
MAAGNGGPLDEGDTCEEEAAALTGEADGGEEGEDDEAEEAEDKEAAEVEEAEATAAKEEGEDDDE